MSYLDQFPIKKKITVTKKFHKTVKHAGIHISGDCLDSELSPMRIKDGATVIMHEADKYNPLGVAKRTVCIALEGQRLIAKYCRFYDGVNGVLVLQQFNPFEEFCIPLSHIEALFVIDDIVESPE